MKKLIPIIVFLIILIPQRIFASTNYNTLTLTPTLTRISLSRGDIYKGKIKIINNSVKTAYISVGIVGFRQNGNSNTPLFSKKINNKSQAIHWVHIKNIQSIKGNTNLELKYIINIPTNASSGGHYIAIIINKRIGNTNIEESLRSLIIIDIKGKMKISGFVKTFSTSNFFNFSNKIVFNINFENTGDIELAPQGFIIIKNLWGGVVNIIPINPTSSLDLSHSQRKYQNIWNNKGFLYDSGIYNAQLILNYGYGSTFYNINKNIKFYIINPLYVIILLGIIIFIYIIIKKKWGKK